MLPCFLKSLISVTSTFKSHLWEQWQCLKPMQVVTFEVIMVQWLELYLCSNSGL